MTPHYWKHKTAAILAKSLSFHHDKNSMHTVRFNRYSAHDDNVSTWTLEQHFDQITAEEYERAFERIPEPTPGPWSIDIATGEIKKVPRDEIYTTSRRSVR